MLPNALFLGYLMASGSFADFFDMTFAGTTEFKNNALSMREIMDNAYIIVFLAILLVIPVAILFDTIKHKNYNKDKICLICIFCLYIYKQLKYFYYALNILFRAFLMKTIDNRKK